jgi:hypothetical protein
MIHPPLPAYTARFEARIHLLRMESPSQQTSTDRPRVILLGASNLTRAISTVVETARQIVGSPIDCYVAMGHGRSFGMETTVFGRTLPGILPCGLWKALKGAPPASRTFILLTDVGNDIPYGATPESILAWLSQCLQQAGTTGTRLALTQLPLATLATLSRRRYHLLRRLLFPGSEVSYEMARERIEVVNDGLNAIAERFGAAPIEMPAAWYGPDKIHIKARRFPTAWPTILQAWSPEAPRPVPHFSLWRYLRCRTARGQDVRFFRRDISMVQPARTLADGTTLHLY